MHIKYIRAKNFLSIKDEIEIDFTKYGNIVNIKGENRDQGPGASNGSGKTSIVSIIAYSLYGELLKSLNHKQVINLSAGKNLETEIQFSLEGHEYKIIRRRKPDELEFWKDGVNESKGGIPATQEEIIKTIKLNYTSFINIVCFGQHNTKQFLICKPADKRIIAENLLSLEKYNKYCKIAKDKQKVIEDKLKYLSTVYEKSLKDIAFNERQISQLTKQQTDWQNNKTNQIERLTYQISKVKEEINQLPKSSSSDSIIKLQTINKELEDKQKQKNKLNDGLLVASEKMNQIKEENQNTYLSIKEFQFAIKRLEKELEELKTHTHNLVSKEGAKCPVCYGTINSSNFKDVLEHNKSKEKELLNDKNNHESSLKLLQEKHTRMNNNLVKIKEVYDEAKAKEFLVNRSIKELEHKRMTTKAECEDNSSAAQLLLHQKIENLQEQIEFKEAESDPFVIVVQNSKEELSKLKIDSRAFKEEINELDGQLPYYDFWIKAFGDTGIRSFVIGEIIPILNDRINYWLQFLIDNKIKLSFNNELEEKIEREPFDGDLFVYNAMSGGEHQRIDLGIALAFAQVMMLTSGTCPSIISLDEVGTNLDRPGIQAVFNMICELSKERQVLITTHDPDLQEMLSGYDTIKAIKENGFTKIE